MKRSEISKIIKDAIAFLGEHKFLLPPFAYFTPEEWKEKITNMMKSETMFSVGTSRISAQAISAAAVFSFSLSRSGNAHNPDDKKVYAEKIAIVEEKIRSLLTIIIGISRRTSSTAAAETL